MNKWILSTVALLTIVVTCGGALAMGTQGTHCMVQWLSSIGIDRTSALNYSTLFYTQRVDQRSLQIMSEAQLAAVGVNLIGHRVLIHHAAIWGTHDLCLNGGSCVVDTATTFKCSCLAAFSGDTCAIASGGCRVDTCHNGGSCRQISNTAITCNCPVGYHGDLCQYVSEGNATLVKNLTNKVAQLTHRYDSAIFDISNTIRQTSGLRFFREWLELDIMDCEDIRYFSIGEREFLGAVSTTSTQVRHGLVIYEIINSDHLVHVQTIQSESISSIKPFSLGNSYYIVVAHYFRRDVRVNSKLYRWNGSQFVLSTSPTNNFRTTGVMDVDFTQDSKSNSFLAFAAHDNLKTYNIPTYVYRNHPNMGNDFLHYQSLPTTGAKRIHFFTHQDTTYLLVAQQRSADRNYLTNSTVFRWNSTYFEVFQQIQTYGACDLLPFEIGPYFFIVAVNSHQGSSHNIESKVYRLTERGFVEHAVLDTRGASMAHMFRIQTQTFLAVANSYDDNNGSFATPSVIYLVDGPNFVPFQEIATQRAMYMHTFKLKNGCTALAVANEAGKSKIYKWSSLSYSSDPCW